MNNAIRRPPTVDHIRYEVDYTFQPINPCEEIIIDWSFILDEDNQMTWRTKGGQKMNPLLKRGMVLFKGVDHREIPYYLVFTGDGNTAVLPPDAEESISMLGLKPKPHWKKDLQEQGIKAIDYVCYHQLKENQEIEIDPIILEVYKKGINNENLLHLLKGRNQDE